METFREKCLKASRGGSKRLWSCVTLITCGPFWCLNWIMWIRAKSQKPWLCLWLLFIYFFSPLAPHLLLGGEKNPAFPDQLAKSLIVCANIVQNKQEVGPFCHQNKSCAFYNVPVRFCARRVMNCSEVMLDRLSHCCFDRCRHQLSVSEKMCGVFSFICFLHATQETLISA